MGENDDALWLGAVSDRMGISWGYKEICNQEMILCFSKLSEHGDLPQVMAMRK
jgi:hypothetical protein